ncbi:molybdenum cofactor biosynthesis protein MoaE [Moraxella catarrhalis]|uniref:molybdenum cofactor biosynthesis protein MoaE n=1 Tax=Moraxella catarrhalis TaxID=480 RepID=UPI0007E48AA1|nr:molybdenum cofactor biosynthesis protein MoaE [Moraxella catarrhalis]OAV13117.1 Molybdenum cofactor biosynthesis protein MoaE [Moraxella catarrhalis]OAV28481.1 Molybdenum cofactor biosynthesis protein MoaE [Moraxella catarrhalis]OAV29128.1 Molybdenum cofactor biosynthesis protein MoaE [Moraxella catarrhalis]OAV31446.1 Molybdenum cofactor biosynthesis protein MoaE [Moraxella catarrhalis]
MAQKLHQGSSKISLSHEAAYHVAITDGFALLDTSIDEKKLKKGLLDDRCGALVTFEGWVRNHNNSRPVEKLTYYGYEALALNQGKLLISEACQRFKIENAIAMHRIGDLNIGDMAVWIGVSAHHRYPAFEACQWLLDAIKAQIPIWKQEFYTDSNQSLWLSNNG